MNTSELVSAAFQTAPSAILPDLPATPLAPDFRLKTQDFRPEIASISSDFNNLSQSITIYNNLSQSITIFHNL